MKKKKEAFAFRSKILEAEKNYFQELGKEENKRDNDDSNETEMIPYQDFETNIAEILSSTIIQMDMEHDEIQPTKLPADEKLINLGTYQIDFDDLIASETIPKSIPKILSTTNKK